MQEIIEYIDALLNEEYSRLEIIESLISEFGSEYPDYDYSKWREIVKTRIEETKGNKDDKDGYTSIPIQSSIIDGLQKKFIECALTFNTSRTQWHAYMDSLISKHGMPYLYVGSVNYMHDHEYDFMSVINEIKEFSEEEKSIRLQKEIDFLKKWKFPGTYSVAFFAFGGRINICGNAYGVDRVNSYNISQFGENVIYSIKINSAGVKKVSIPSDDVRSNIEMKALLEACCHNISFNRTTFKSDGDIEGYLESNIDESIIKFEGVSLAHPRKEFIYAINDLAAKKKSISILSYKPGWAIIKNECVGYPIEWRFYISGKGYVFERLSGSTDEFIGYNKTREAYDKLVAYFTSILGDPTEVEDVPIDVHKNSIFKLLREGEYSIETTYDKDDIYATVELQVYDEEGEKRVGYVRLYIRDSRLYNINNQ